MVEVVEVVDVDVVVGGKVVVDVVVVTTSAVGPIQRTCGPEGVATLAMRVRIE